MWLYIKIERKDSCRLCSLFISWILFYFILFYASWFFHFFVPINIIVREHYSIEKGKGMARIIILYCHKHYIIMIGKQ